MNKASKIWYDSFTFLHNKELISYKTVTKRMSGWKNKQRLAQTYKYIKVAYLKYVPIGKPYISRLVRIVRELHIISPERTNDPLYPIGQYYFYTPKINPRSIWPASHTRVIHSPERGRKGRRRGTAAATLTFNLENCPLPLIYFHYCQLFSRRRRSLQEPAIPCHIIGEETFLSDLSRKKWNVCLFQNGRETQEKHKSRI